NARSQVAPGEYQLSGDVRVRGFELAAAGRITSRRQVLAGYTFLDAKIINASPLDGTLGKVPLNTPRHSASLWTTHNVKRERRVGAAPTSRSSLFANNTHTIAAPYYLRFDASVAWHQKRDDVRLNLVNIGNRLNYHALAPSDGGRSVPGIDRTALLTV